MSDLLIAPSVLSADIYLHRVRGQVRELSKKPGVVIDPATPLVCVTLSNDDDGFAGAVERLILPRARSGNAPDRDSDARATD